MSAGGSKETSDVAFDLRHFFRFAPTWRVSAASRIQELEDALAMVPSGQRCSPAHATVRQRLDDAWSVLSSGSLARKPGAEDSHRATLRVMYRIDKAGAVWTSIHRADEQLILVADDAWVRTRAERVGARLSREERDQTDSSTSTHRAFLADLAARAPGADGKTFPEADRTRLSAILRQLNRRSEQAEEKLRSFRNVLLGLQVALLLLLAGIAVAAHGAPSSWSLCGPPPGGGAQLCPDGSGSPGPSDVALVELMGGLGGLISTIIFIARLDSFPNPHGLQLVQALLKVPAGAALALVMTLVVQRGTLDVVAAQPGTRVLPLAVLFGLGQQAVTAALDQRARGLLGESRASAGAADASDSTAGTSRTPAVPA